LKSDEGAASLSRKPLTWQSVGLTQGVKDLRWDKALAEADALEDEELIRKLALPK
jgi:hypothetical protein